MRNISCLSVLAAVTHQSIKRGGSKFRQTIVRYAVPNVMKNVVIVLWSVLQRHTTDSIYEMSLKGFSN
jgi:hypothetical protein